MMAMIAITTSSSIRVKARRVRAFIGSLFPRSIAEWTDGRRASLLAPAVAVVPTNTPADLSELFLLCSGDWHPVPRGDPLHGSGEGHPISTVAVEQLQGEDA